MSVENTKIMQDSIVDDVIELIQREDMQENLKAQNINIDMIRFIIEDGKYIYRFLEDIKIDKVDKKFEKILNMCLMQTDLTKKEFIKSLNDIVAGKESQYTGLVEILYPSIFNFIPKYSSHENIILQGGAYVIPINFKEKIAIDIINIIYDIVKKIEAKQNCKNSEKSQSFLKDLQNKINLLKKIILEHFGVELKNKEDIKLFLEMYDVFFTDKYCESLKKDYLNECFKDIKNPTFQKTLNIDILDEEIEIFIKTIKYIQDIENEISSLKIKKLTLTDRENIQDYLYAINDFFGLGIKKSINDNMFINLVTYGYYDYIEKQSHGKNAKK